MSTNKFFQVFEITPTGVKHSISKKYPTWLGCKRVCNRIARELSDCIGYRYIICEV